VTVPCTAAANCWEPLITTLVEPGETVTELTIGVAPAVVTVIVPEADLVLSATLVAVTVSVPAFAGAV
jgi:hypothetical protein